MVTRRGGAVVVGDEGHHLGYQVLHGAELAALEQPAGQDREEQLHLVQPRGMGRGVVGVEPRVVNEPPAGVAGDVRGAVVQHQVHLQVGGHGGVQIVQEGDEVGGSVAVGVGGLNDPTAVDVQRCQQGGGAVADVLVLLAAGRPGAGRVVGRVRLRAVMPAVSSTLSTKALVGGTRYSPQMSAARSQKPGSSGRVIQLRTRCGLISRSARIRPIWEAEMPMSDSAWANWL
jgi:hypothetical protein